MKIKRISVEPGVAQEPPENGWYGQPWGILIGASLGVLVLVALVKGRES